MTPRLEPVRDPSAWTAADLARDRSWDYELSARGQRELEDALRLVQEHGLALAEITRETFPLPSLQEVLGDVQHQLRAGRGFALLRGYPWTRMEEEAPNESPVSDYRVPVFSAADGTVTCRFNAGWIRKGAERAGTPLTEEDLEMFEFIRATATGHAFSFPLHAGEIAWMNNYTVFHGRAAHEPVADEQRKRLLLRLWLDLPDVRPFADKGRVRYGVIRHGKLGWTAADLLAGNHRTPHRRRPDGVPLV